MISTAPMIPAVVGVSSVTPSTEMMPEKTK